VTAALLAVEAALFGVGVGWVLFARTLLRADVDGPGALVAAALCVVHLWAALAVARHRNGPSPVPLVPLVPVLVLQVPIIVCSVTAGEPLFLVLALAAAAVLLTGVRTLLVRD
jgi:hypothetical protein